jgi:hypothetical protein
MNRILSRSGALLLFGTSLLGCAGSHDQQRPVSQPTQAYPQPYPNEQATSPPPMNQEQQQEEDKRRKQMQQMENNAPDREGTPPDEVPPPEPLPPAAPPIGP